MRENKTIKVLIFALAVIGLVFRVFFGFDNDEQYTITIAYRLFKGDRLFKDLWDPYQLVGIFSYPIFYLWNLLNGTISNVILVERLFGLIVQILIWFLLYKVFKKYVSNDYTFVSSLLFMVLLPKQTLIFDHANGLNWFLTISILTLYLYFVSTNSKYLLISSVSFALAVLSYPTQILLFIVIELVLLFIFKDKKACLYFFLPCFIMGICFVCYFAIKYGYTNLVHYVSMILKDGSHSRIEINRIVKNILLLVVFLASNYLFGLVCEGFIKKLNNKKINLRYNFMIILWPLLFVILFIFGFVIPPLSMYRRYFVISIIGVYLFKKQNRSINELIFLIIPIMAAIICLISSNQGIDSASGYLAVSFSYTALLLIKNNDSLFTKISILLILASMCFINIFSARVTKTISYPTYNLKKSNDCFNSVIYITDTDKQLFNEAGKLTAQVNGKEILYVGKDPLCYVLTNSNVLAPQTTATPVYDNQWIEYYSTSETKLDYIILDKAMYESVTEFKKTIFGDYLLKKNYKEIYNGERLILIKIR